MPDRSYQDVSALWEELVRPGGRIIYLVLDGLGGIRHVLRDRSALERAHTPHLDTLARGSACGRLEIVAPGITPGSGPGHLALFGYDPLRFRIGRGILSALGIDFDLRPGDVAARVNFATLDDAGRIIDRRAGRISTERNSKLCQKIRDRVELDFDGQYFFEPESEHRAVFVLRGSGLGAGVSDTDPQRTGVPPNPPGARDPESEATAELVATFLGKANRALEDEKPANTLLMRGFESHGEFPSLRSRYGLKGLCIAAYPMYRGLSRLLGMDVADRPADIADSFRMLADSYSEAHDFYFLHVKDTDSAGEDGDYAAKVRCIEQVDDLLPELLALQPDVLVVTGDHSTPAVMASHSWHPVPVLIHGAHAGQDELRSFDEHHCVQGSLGLRPALHLMGLALANAHRLAKFGA